MNVDRSTSPVRTEPAGDSVPVLSIVTTLYNSARTIETFCQEAIAAAEGLVPRFEIVIVDDGSPDNSLAIACGLAAKDNRIKVVELSRNFGHHKALMTGLMHASGDYCFLIDSDLEERPALLAQFWGKLQSSDADVVYGYQTVRAGSFFRRLSGDIAFWLFDHLISPKIPANHITVRLMRRRYVDSLLLHKEQQTAIGGLWVITGYRQIGLTVDKVIRDETTYSFLRRWHVLIDSITSFSEKPLVAIFYLGLIISALSGVCAVGLLLRWMVGGVGVPGWLSVMISVWLLGGIAIFCMGLIGIYLSKIFIETKNRPYTIVRQIHAAVPDDNANEGGQ
ncbi:MAG TPA: glycosyltransferase family 2 protein [Terriglobia bacterium]|nr:glycosyltransferase family 2 protein [Terriglobia bacterium]